VCPLTRGHTVVFFKIVQTINKAYRAQNLSYLNFTRRAAREMLKRAAHAITTSSSVINQVWGGTFHATANRLLRIYAQAAGISPDSTIIDQSDAEDLINVIRHKKSFSKLWNCLP
jgi:DNA helicase-2/ATP-dependent DNA helicase PcrA